METQDTPENLQARLLTAEQRLLTEGIPSYFDAILAIQELEQNIQKRCQRVLCEKLKEFEGVIGIELAANKIKYYSFPITISDSVKEGYKFLGVEILLQSTGTAYVSLVLAKDYFTVCVALRLRDHALFDPMGERVKEDEIVKRDESLSLEVKSRLMLIELYKEIPLDRLSSFEGILSDLMKEWSLLWKRVGGLGKARTQADSLV